jgi:archaellum component FlaG (FlaF/FlaG flagellin family)
MTVKLEVYDSIDIISGPNGPIERNVKEISFHVNNKTHYLIVRDKDDIDTLIDGEFLLSIDKARDLWYQYVNDHNAEPL